MLWLYETVSAQIILQICFLIFFLNSEMAFDEALKLTLSCIAVLAVLYFTG